MTVNGKLGLATIPANTSNGAMMDDERLLVPTRATSWSALLLVMVVGAIVWEALGRFRAPVPTPGLTILVVLTVFALVGLLTLLGRLGAH